MNSLNAFNATSFAFFVSLAFAASSASANTWTNVLGGVFSDPGNWKEGTAPTSGVNADFSKAPGTYTVTFTGDAASALTTFDGVQDVTLDVGAGHFWNIDNGANMVVGDMVGCDTHVTVASGCVTNSYRVLLANRAGGSGHIAAHGAGTVFMSNRDDMNIGWGGAGCSAVATAGAMLRGGRSLILGYSATSSNNTVLATGAGTVIGNGHTQGSNAGIVIGQEGSFNTVRVEDGAILTNTFTHIYLGLRSGSSGNRLEVDNATVHGAGQLSIGSNTGCDGNSVVLSNGSKATFFRGIVLVGQAGSNNSLDITGGSYLHPGTHLYVGQDATAWSNMIHIAGAGTVVTNSNFDFNCANNGSYNRWIVEDGAYVCPVRSMITGTAGAASHNTTVYRGEGTYLKTIQGNLATGQVGTNNVTIVEDRARADIASQIIVGLNAGACSNRLEIISGAVVTNGANVSVGSNATAADNLLVVSNATLYSKSVVSIGNGGPRNRLEVLGGTVFTTGHHFYFGNSVGSSNTTVRIAGEGTRIDNIYDIDVGNNAQDCRMDIEDGAAVRSNRDFFVGHNATASNNLVRVSNARLDVTYDNNRVLRVNYGGTLLVEGTNTSVTVSQLQFRGNSTLAFTIGRGGFQTPVTTRRPTYEAGTKLVVNAMDFAKAGGGRVTLMEYIAKTGTIMDDMTLIPEGIEVEETETSLIVKVPSFAGTVLFLR